MKYVKLVLISMILQGCCLKSVAQNAPTISKKEKIDIYQFNNIYQEKYEKIDHHFFLDFTFASNTLNSKELETLIKLDENIIAVNYFINGNFYQLLNETKNDLVLCNKISSSSYPLKKAFKKKEKANAVLRNSKNQLFLLFNSRITNEEGTYFIVEMIVEVPEEVIVHISCTQLNLIPRFISKELKIKRT